GQGERPRRHEGRAVGTTELGASAGRGNGQVNEVTTEDAVFFRLVLEQRRGGLREQPFVQRAACFVKREGGLVPLSLRRVDGAFQVPKVGVKRGELDRVIEVFLRVGPAPEVQVSDGSVAPRDDRLRVEVQRLRQTGDGLLVAAQVSEGRTPD